VEEQWRNSGVRSINVQFSKSTQCSSNSFDSIIAHSNSNYTEVGSWKDDVKCWPPISTARIHQYLIEEVDVDELPASATKSMAAYNYVDSGWVSFKIRCLG